MTIHQKFTGDNSQLLKAYQDVAAQNTRLEQQIGKLAAGMGKGAKSGKQDMDLWGQSTKYVTSSLTGLVSGWLSVASVISVVNEEIEHHKRLAKEALDTHTSLAASQSDLFINSWGKPKEVTEANLKQLRQMANEVKVGEVHLTGAFASAQSTGVGTDKQQMDSVRMAAELSPQRPEGIGNLSKSLLMGQQLTGKSADEVAALFLSGGGSAFLENPEQQSRFLRQTMAGVMASSRGDKTKAAEQAVEFGAALTTMVGEERGESARTQTISTSASLDKFFTEGFERTVHGHKFRDKPKTDPGAVLDRFRMLQNDPKLAQRYLDGSSREALFDGPLRRALLDKNSEEAKRITEAQEKVGYNTQPLQPLLDQLRSGTPQIEAERMQRTGQVNKEQHELRSTKFSREANALAIVSDTLSKTRKYSPEPWGLKIAEDKAQEQIRPVRDELFGSDPIESSIATLQTRAAAIRKPGSTFFGKNMRSASRPIDELNQDERGALEYVQKSIEALREIQAAGIREAEKATRAMEENTRATRETNDILRTQKPNAAPAARAERGRFRER